MIPFRSRKLKQELKTIWKLKLLEEIYPVKTDRNGATVRWKLHNPNFNHFDRSMWQMVGRAITSAYFICWRAVITAFLDYFGLADITFDRIVYSSVSTIFRDVGWAKTHNVTVRCPLYMMCVTDRYSVVGSLQQTPGWSLQYVLKLTDSWPMNTQYVGTFVYINCTCTYQSQRLICVHTCLLTINRTVYQGATARSLPE